MTRNPIRLLPGILLVVCVGVSPGAAASTNDESAAPRARETAQGGEGKAVSSKLSPDVQMHLNSGDAEFRRNKYRRAIADYDEAVKLAPGNAELLVIRGKAYAAGNDYRRAIADYDEAIKLAPGNADMLLIRGKAYAARNDYRRSDTAYRINYRRAIADYDEAIKQYDESIKLAPGNAILFVGRGNAYAAKSDYRHAIADYDEAIRLKPDSAIAWRLRGVEFLRTGDCERAITDFSEVIRLQRDSAMAFVNRGIAYRRLAAMRDNPTYRCTQWTSSVLTVLLPNAQFDLAIADFDQAIRLQPDLAVAYLERARLYHRLTSNKQDGQDWKLSRKRALADYQQAIRLLRTSLINSNSRLLADAEGYLRTLECPRTGCPDPVYQDQFQNTGDMNFERLFFPAYPHGMESAETP